MIALVKFEIKKIFRNKVMLVVLIFGLLLNAFAIYTNDKMNSSNQYMNGKFKVYQKIKGEITQEKYDYIFNCYTKVNDLVEKGNYETEKPDVKYFTGFVFGDRTLFKRFLKDYQYIINYNDQIGNALKLAKDNLSYYKNPEDISLNKKFIDTFTNRGVSEYYETTNMTNYLAHDFSTFMIILLLLIFVSGIFSEDMEYQYHQILYTTKLGGRQLFLARIMAAMVLTMLFCLLFYLEDFAVYHKIDILEGFLNPIYSVPNYQYSSISCTILAFDMLSIFTKLICLFITVYIIALCSLVNKKVLISIVTSFVIIFALLYFNQVFLNPFHFVDLKQTLYSYQMISIFHTYLPSIIVYFIGILIEFICISIIMYKIAKKRGSEKHVSHYPMGIQKNYH